MVEMLIVLLLDTSIKLNLFLWALSIVVEAILLWWHTPSLPLKLRLLLCLFVAMFSITLNGLFIAVSAMFPIAFLIEFAFFCVLVRGFREFAEERAGGPGSVN